MTVEEAIQVFVQGFAFTRSFTHPYLPELVDCIWVLRDAPRKQCRSEEFVAYGVPPQRVDAIVRAHSRGPCRICIIRAEDEPAEPIRAACRQLGYRLNTTEAFMVHDLKQITPIESPLPLVRVTTLEQSEKLANAAGSRQLLPAHLAAEPPPLRQYMVTSGDRPIGWLKSIVTERATWCASVYVDPAFRRRGIGRAMMTRMLLDDREAGAEASVLLASHAGALLYPTVGYCRIGELFVYTPRRPR